MSVGQRSARFAVGIVACFFAVAAFAAQRKELRFTLGPGANISIVNSYGPVTLKPSSGGQVLVTAVPASGKVEVDSNQTGDRVEIHTHFLQHAGQDDGRVEYEVRVPPNATVTVRVGNGPVRAEKLRGDLSLEGDSAPIEVRDITGGQIRARSVTGPITLANVSGCHVELTSVAGEITLKDVTGPKVAVNTTKSAIRYAGNFAGGGEYSFTNHSGDIAVTLPQDASVEMTARSVSGSVVDDFPFKPRLHPAFQTVPGHSFAGTANSGASLVRLRSFSGTISVKKQ